MSREVQVDGWHMARLVHVIEALETYVNAEARKGECDESSEWYAERIEAVAREMRRQIKEKG